MKLYIKNMVSNRCKMLVKSELEKLGLHYIIINLCEVEIEENISEDLLGKLGACLKKSGLELIDDKKSVLVEKMKNVIIELVHYSNEKLKVNFSDYLSERLNYDYTYLANLFSKNQGTTLEHFFITHKIERVKELLLYDELNLSDIAIKMHYSSCAHLSNQFKKLTGLTPSQFKNLRYKKRKSLEYI